LVCIQFIQTSWITEQCYGIILFTDDDIDRQGRAGPKVRFV